MIWKHSWAVMILVYYLLLLHRRVHRRILCTGGARRHSSGANKGEKGAATERRAGSSQAGPPDTGLQTFPACNSLWAATRFLQPDCRRAEKRATAQVRNIQSLTEIFCRPCVCQLLVQLLILTLRLQNFKQTCFLMQKWFSRKKCHAAHESHAWKGRAKREKKVQLYSSKNTAARWKSTAGYSVIYTVYLKHSSHIYFKVMFTETSNMQVFLPVNSSLASKQPPGPLVWLAWVILAISIVQNLSWPWLNVWIIYFNFICWSAVSY